MDREKNDVITSKTPPSDTSYDSSSESEGGNDYGRKTWMQELQNVEPRNDQNTPDHHITEIGNGFDGYNTMGIKGLIKEYIGKP